MIHLSTIVLVLMLTVLLQGAVWCIVWRAQRHQYDLGYIAASFVIYALSMLLVVARPVLPYTAFAIIASNVLIMLSSGFMVQGLARFLNQPGYPRLMGGCILFTAIFWPAMMLLDPDNVGLRVVMSNILATITVSAMIMVLRRDRTQPSALRWFGKALMAAEIVALTIRSVTAIQFSLMPAPDFDATFQPWYFFFFHFFLLGLFLLLLLMVGFRLTADLRQKNQDLQDDLQERRRLQDELSATLQTKEAVLQEQQQLLRMVTHEFRTPLVVIDRAAELVGMLIPQPLPDVTERLDSIRSAGQRLLRLIERFLSVERTEHDVLQIEVIDLPLLLARVRRHFEMMDMGGRVTVRIDPELPDYRGDTEMLSTALINLIDNALKYAPEDSPVEVVARQAGQAICVDVMDRGIGIPDAEAGMIGHRFFRASNTKPATGTGLGLYNTRRLLDYHQGRLDLQPRPGGGTIATIRLPLDGVALSALVVPA